ncbi:MAG: c-type cytochrome, methanol metabolism-related [Pseudolabrys sp.]
MRVNAAARLSDASAPIKKDVLLRHSLVAATLVAAVFCIGTGHAFADGSGDPAAVKQDDGKWSDKEGNPTYHVDKDGTVDWYTFSGFRRYNSACIVCHGPDGAGSTYAPALVDSLKALSYSDFAGTVAGGKQEVNTAADKVMPAFGTNPNVMCYLDDIYVYLRARANGAVGRGRPSKHADKSKSAQAAEDSCMGPEK